MSVQACIFDWAGTTVDFGCFAPIYAFKNAFMQFGIEPTVDEIRQPMGMLKLDHIKSIFAMDRINQLWEEKYKKAPTESDIDHIYVAFEEKLMADLDQYAKPIENVVTIIEQLRKMKILIGSTTGYTNKMMEVVIDTAEKLGYHPDYVSTPDIAGFGRPRPEMIYDNMKYFNLEKRENIVKIGDTISDIKEGYNAGVWSVGVVKGSSILGLSEQEYKEPLARNLVDEVKRQYLEAGADFVIDQIDNLPGLIDQINIFLGLGDKPNGYQL